jgi:hypothetical protein
MKTYKHPLIIAVAVVGLMFVGLGLAIIRHQYFYSFELADGVRVVQAPAKHTYDIHTSKGVVIENVFGWIIRPEHLYGAYAEEAYFLINLENLAVTRFNNLRELNMTLKVNNYPRYHMNDEENISHLKYHGGRNRKYR